MGTTVETGPFGHLAEDLADLQLPTTDAEEWRYSRVADIDPTRFARAPVEPALESISTARATIDDLLGASTQPPSATVVVVDGSVSAAEAADPVRIDVHAVQTVQTEQASPNAFALLNERLCSAQVTVTVDAQARVVAPIVVASVVTTDGVVVAPRMRIELGANSEATLVEVHRSTGPSDSLVVPVTEVEVGRDATLRHVLIQDVSVRSDVVGSVTARVEASGTYDTWIAAIGGRYARTRVDCQLLGRGADARLVSLYAGGGDQMRDLRTFQDHLARDTTSELVFKGAVDGRAHAVYTGLIRIHPDARGANAEQSNRIMTLSDDAWAESVPNLEIENNDVRCAHASTVGPVDADQRFYLETRGVPTEVAERLIVAGFFDEVLDRCPVPGIAEAIRPTLAELMSGDRT
ncbi:MAG: Fe-S cluster assembly protein SufD [Actinobacteria bacterium]|nr:Fe-S cluster assembly protein SufD [Actinomycetota bacterium]